MKKAILSILLLHILFISSYGVEPPGEIEVGAICRLTSLDGTVFEGILDEKDDTSLIIQCMGTPYKLSFSLIETYTLLIPPRDKSDTATAEWITFEELLHRAGAVGKIQILISNGTVFKGIVTDIDSENVKIDVGGSQIPISRDLISHIIKTPLEVQKQSLKKQADGQTETDKPAGPFDTVYVKSMEQDEYGNSLPPLPIIGKIQKNEPDGLVIVTPNGVKREFAQTRILRVSSHNAPVYEEKIKAYAKPLFCPQNMILVDVPPGKEGRPFFKVCVDKYEYPNHKDVVPQTSVTFEEAAQICKKSGKRLCSTEEWQWSCSGLEEYTYPYGFRMDKVFCNREGAQKVEPSGVRYRCVCKFGVYDMVGNVFEWVTGPDGTPMLMGGPYSKCQTISPGLSGAAKPQIGFRCCKSN